MSRGGHYVEKLHVSLSDLAVGFGFGKVTLGRGLAVLFVYSIARLMQRKYPEATEFLGDYKLMCSLSAPGSFLLQQKRLGTRLVHTSVYVYWAGNLRSHNHSIQT